METTDYDMAGPCSYIIFAEKGSEFTLDRLTGSIHGTCQGKAVEFTWDGNNEIDPQAAMAGRKSSTTAPPREICLPGRRRYFPFLLVERSILQQPVRSDRRAVG